MVSGVVFSCDGIAQFETKKVRRVDSSVETGQDQRRQAGPDDQVPLVEAAGELEVASDECLHISHDKPSLEASVEATHHCK